MNKRLNISLRTQLLSFLFMLIASVTFSQSKVNMRIIPATFPGGEDSLSAYFDQHIQLPNSVGNVSGQVMVQFHVGKDGTISQVQMLSGFNDCDACNQAILDAVKSMPKWTPKTTSNGGTYDDQVTMPISIQHTTKSTENRRFAEFPGGQEALGEYLTHNLHVVSEKTIRGTVYVKFTVLPDGTPTNFTFEKKMSDCDYCNDQVMKALQAMPKWIPATDQNGNAVSSEMVLPVVVSVIAD